LFTLLSHYCQTGDCQKRDDNVPVLVGYTALFDGHDGPACSEYCSQGLLSHILAEISDSYQKTSSSNKDRNSQPKMIETVSGDSVSTPIEAGFINAFHQAQTRFANDMPPPTFRDVELGPAATRSKSSILRQWLRTGKRDIKGGTTACVVSVVSSQRSPVFCVILSIRI
jgi:hypothetical protein